MTDLEALTITLWGEARGEPIEGMIGVAMVMRNRLLEHYRGAQSYADVCTAHAQFSAWTDETPQMRMEQTLFESAQFGFSSVVLNLCRSIAAATIAGNLADNTAGANHYYATSIPEPDWAKGAKYTTQLGHHRFLVCA